MAHTEEPGLETQHVVLSGQVGRADWGWLNEGSNESVLVSDFGATQLWT